jgi:hypothetical protein
MKNSYYPVILDSTHSNGVQYRITFWEDSTVFLLEVSKDPDEPRIFKPIPEELAPSAIAKDLLGFEEAKLDAEEYFGNEAAIEIRAQINADNRRTLDGILGIKRGA